MRGFRVVGAGVREVNLVDEGREVFQGDAVYALTPRTFDDLPSYLPLEIARLSLILSRRQTRALVRRRQTPIITLAAGDVEREARRAGTNVFLKKPGEVSSLGEMVARLPARKLRP